MLFIMMLMLRLLVVVLVVMLGLGTPCTAGNDTGSIVDAGNTVGN